MSEVQKYPKPLMAINSNSPKTMSRDTETPAAHPQMKMLPEARILLNEVRIRTGYISSATVAE